MLTTTAIVLSCVTSFIDAIDITAYLGDVFLFLNFFTHILNFNINLIYCSIQPMYTIDKFLSTF
ncbi:hypothetical protein MEZE111188_18745 [Mesobacillus zeae]